MKAHDFDKKFDKGTETHPQTKRAKVPSELGRYRQREEDRGRERAGIRQKSGRQENRQGRPLMRVAYKLLMQRHEGMIKK